MQEIILVKIGELFLKGLNKKDFEKKLIKDIKLKISKFGEFKVSVMQSVITITPVKLISDLDEALDTVKNVFGVSSVSKASLCEKNIDSIKYLAKGYLKEQLLGAKTFKVETKRADKSFPLGSYEVSAVVGEYLLGEFSNLTVDVHHPDLVICIEIRENFAYIRGNTVKGIGGLPAFSCGKVLSLISGGLDSPVASFLMAKRGAEIVALHFTSPPYTSQRATDKVITLLKKLNKYIVNIKLILVNLTPIQENIKKYCKEDYFTIILRRFMFKIAEKIALENHCKAIITGESLGQVASQTLGAICCTNESCKILPILRPLIGMDKEDIIKIAREIDTFETSTLPYEDCCTVFVPKHPRTRPRLEEILKEEKKLDLENLIKSAAENLEFKIIEDL